MNGDATLRSEPRYERREGDRLRRDPALLSAVLDGSPLLTFVVDAKGRIVLFNQACEALSGRTGDAMRGRLPWDVLLQPEEAEGWKAAFDPLRPERVPARAELSWKGRDGQIRRIAWWTSVLANEQGLPRHVVFTGIDLTELRSTERRAAEIAERERERFGQDLHDGLGQDLTAIALGCGVLREKLARSAPGLVGEAGGIEKLVQKAVSKARALAQGVYPAGLVASALPDYLREMARAVRETFGVRCELAWAGDVELRDESVTRNIYWIVQEAVTNAVRHGGCRAIGVSAARDGAAGVRVQVRDDGRGIGKDAALQGAGLRVMASRARAIGAQLRVADHPEGGVLVDCRIPRV